MSQLTTAILDRALARHGLPSTRLVLEVTESLLMADREGAVRVLQRLRDTGVGISIDDQAPVTPAWPTSPRSR